MTLPEEEAHKKLLKNPYCRTQWIWGEFKSLLGLKFALPNKLLLKPSVSVS